MYLAQPYGPIGGESSADAVEVNGLDQLDVELVKETIKMIEAAVPDEFESGAWKIVLIDSELPPEVDDVFKHISYIDPCDDVGKAIGVIAMWAEGHIDGKHIFENVPHLREAYREFCGYDPINP